MLKRELFMRPIYYFSLKQLINLRTNTSLYLTEQQSFLSYLTFQNRKQHIVVSNNTPKRVLSWFKRQSTNDILMLHSFRACTDNFMILKHRFNSLNYSSKQALHDIQLDKDNIFMPLLGLDIINLWAQILYYSKLCQYMLCSF